MAMNEPRVPHQGGAGPEDGILPCGTDLAALWDQQEPASEPTCPHTAGCSHCIAALADFARLRDAVARDRQETGADWEADAVRLTASVMDTVRLELRPGHILALGEDDEDAWIYEAVAARTLRTAVEQVPGVRAGSCRITPGTAPGAGRGRPRTCASRSRWARPGRCTRSRRRSAGRSPLPPDTLWACSSPRST